MERVMIDTEFNDDHVGYTIARRLTLNLVMQLSTRGKITDPGTIVRLLRSDCECEAAFASVSQLMIDLDDASDSVIAVRLDSIGRYVPSAPHRSFCRKAADEVASIQRYRATTHAPAINGLNDLLREVTLRLSPDSVYVLHFWGTWCQPCIAEMEQVQSIEETLREKGIAMIHIAAENPNNVNAWTRLARSFRGSSIVSTGSPLDPRFPPGQLLIRSYPTYVVVGEGNRILHRYKSILQVRSHFQ